MKTSMEKESPVGLSENKWSEEIALMAMLPGAGNQSQVDRRQYSQGQAPLPGGTDLSTVRKMIMLGGK